jgi:F-type H+-transporting ATPase subunit delta
LDRFMGILLEKKRWDALREIPPVYERLANDAGGILAVQADTATSLTEEEITKVRRSLEKSWGGPVTLGTRVREDLLGGVVLRVGDQVWDNSLKGQLERLREVWLAGTL